MYTFVRFADLGPFSNIVHSHPRFENTPSGLILDRRGRVVGHGRAPLSTRRFATFEGRAGEDVYAAVGAGVPGGGGGGGGSPVTPATPATPRTPVGSAPPSPISLATPGGSVEDLDAELDKLLAGMGMEIGGVEAGKKKSTAVIESSTDLKELVNDGLARGLAAERAGGGPDGAYKAAYDYVVGRGGEKLAKEVGAQVKTLVRKHRAMEDKDVKDIVAKTGRGGKRVGAGAKRGGRRPSSAFPKLRRLSRAEVQGVLRSLSIPKSSTVNKGPGMDAIEIISEESKVPVSTIVDQYLKVDKQDSAALNAARRISMPDIIAKYRTRASSPVKPRKSSGGY